MPPRKRPLIESIFPNSMNSTVGSYAPKTLQGHAGQMTEPPPVVVPPTEDQLGGGDGEVQGGERATGKHIAELKIKEPGTAKVEQPYTMKGNIYAPTPQDELDARQQSEKNIFEAEQRAAIADYQAAGYSEKVMRDMIAIGERDAVVARQLHDTHFARAQQRMNKLYQKVDEASSLKVNPYNWHESIGRGGRVSAAFSVLTGQMAAGAGNPNSALKMMDAAIERDIGAQEQNIKAKYEAIRVARGLGQDERMLYKEEIDSLNETRAIAYSALQGRISAAKQHAINAAMYESLGIADDHYNLKKLAAIQAARQNIHIEVNGHVNAASQKMMMQEIQALEKGFVQQRTAAQAAGSDTRPQVEQLHEETVQQQGQSSVAAAPGRAGAVAARRGQTSKPGTTPQAGSEAGTSAAAPVQDQPLGEGPLMPEGPAPQQAAKAPSKGQHVQYTDRDVKEHLRQHRVPAEIIRSGSFGAEIQAQRHGGTLKVTSIKDAANAVNSNRLIPNGGVLTNRDADYVASLVQPPRAELFPGGADDPGYKIQMRAYEYGQEFEEIYETRSTLDEERNTIVAGGNNYKLAEGAIERTDKKAYDAMQGKLAQVATGNRAVMNLAKKIKTHGLSGIFTPEGGINIPGFNSEDEMTMTLANQTITQAMQYIKTHDPTARISDKDLEVGERALGSFLSKGGKFLDFVQSLDGDSYNNTKRNQISNFLAWIAIEAQAMVTLEYENSLVPSYNDMLRQAEDAQELQLWIDEHGAK